VQITYWFLSLAFSDTIVSVISSLKCCAANWPSSFYGI
jgi:hypothetical protein